MKSIFLLVFFASLGISLELQSIRADFTQIVDNGSEAIEYSGSIVASAESMAYWKYETPMIKEVFVQKDSVMIYEPELNQAISHKIKHLDFVEILNSAQKRGDSLISDINGEIFEVVLDGEIPQKVLYTDALDNKVEIILRNVRLNERIDKEIFTPKIPKDADIIYE